MTRKPEFADDILQIVKTVIATAVAWWIAISVLESEIPFLAPWIALMTVFPTVYKSLKHGVQATVASWIGVGLSYVVGTVLGVSLFSFTLALFVGMLVSRLKWIRAEGFNVATTAIFVLGAGYADQAPLLDDRMVEVAVGAAVGIGTNLLIIPPIRDYEAARDVGELNARIGALLETLADTFRDRWDEQESEKWLEQIEDLSQELSSAWTQVQFAEQSRRINPRTRLPRLRPRGPGRDDSSAHLDYAQALQRSDEAVSHLRHMTRSLREASLGMEQWDEEFRERWADLVHYVGVAIADSEVSVDDIRERLSVLTQRFPGIARGEPSEHWPVYGSLIASIEHIANIVKDVEPVQAQAEHISGNRVTE